MPNEVRQRWDSLKNDARLAGLPEPSMQPHRFPDRWEVSVGDWRWTGHYPLNCINKAELWISGYSARMCAEQEAYDCAMEKLTTQESCQRVIDNAGKGGPTDHVLLAKALLGLTADWTHNLD